MPQLRADKNGKLVTRHVIDPSAVSSSSTGLPAPSVKSAEQTERELINEKRASIIERACAGRSVPVTEQEQRNAEACFSWIPPRYLDTISSLMDESPAYDKYGRIPSSLRHAISQGYAFEAMIIAGSHPLYSDLHAAGFDQFRHTVPVKEYFGSTLPRVFKESHVRDFNVWLIASHLGFSDPGTFSDGPIAHYRAMLEVDAHYDEVIKALPVLAPMVDDDSGYLLEYGFEDVIRISVHAASHSDTEIERIAHYVKHMMDSDAYDEEIVDAMLAATSDAPSLTTGWL